MKPADEMTDREVWAHVSWIAFFAALVLTGIVALAGGGAWGLMAFVSPLYAAVRWWRS